MTEFNCDSRLQFGKYKGLKCGLVATFDAQYLSWCCGGLKNFQLSPKLAGLVKEKVSERQKFMLNQQDAWAHGFGAETKAARKKWDECMRKLEWDARQEAKAHTETNKQLWDKV